MGVDSYAEIFTLTLGWHFYGVIWDVLASTGIVFLPFLGMLIEHWKDAFANADDGSSASAAVRALELDVYLAIFVIMMAGIPSSFTTLDRSSTFYAPYASTANPSPTTATGSSPESTFGNSLGGTPAAVPVPIWWYAVTALSSGFTRASIAGTNLNLDEIRKVADEAKRSSIDDAQVRQELQRFYNECFIPARSKYFASEPTGATQAALTHFGPDDTEWVGSHAFRNEPTLYPSMYADREVPGWVFDSDRDADLANSPTPPQWGRPTCQQWWDDSSIGLRSKLLNEASNTSKLITYVNTFSNGLSAERRADLVAQTLIGKTTLNVLPDPYVPTSTNKWGEVGRAAVSAIGTTITHVLTWLTMSVLRPSLPFVQAIMLMAIAMFMAPILIISRYSLNIIVYGALAIFTVKFWSFMWFVADFLDDRLIAAMYPDAADMMTALMSLFQQGDATKATCLNLVILSLYLVLPALWTGLMGAAGVRIGAAVTDAKRAAMANVDFAGGHVQDVSKSIFRNVVGRLRGRR